MGLSAWPWLVVAAMVGAALLGADPDLGSWPAALVVLTAALRTARAASAGPASRRAGLRLLAAGLASYGAGYVAWGVLVARDGVPATPSAADPLWLALYPLALAAIVLLARDAGAVGRTAALDVLTSGCAAGAIGAVVLDRLILDDVTGTPWQVVVGGAYSTLDVVLAAALVAGAVALGPSRAVALAALAVAALLVADVIYLEATAAGLPAILWLPTVLCAGAMLLAARAATLPISLQRPRGAGVVVPAVSGLLALAVLVGDRVWDLGTVSAVLATAALGCALLRLVATVRLERDLRDSRALAHTDELSGLRNRRGLHAALEAAPDPVALALLDLDGFKEVNDSLGHAAGDALLRAVGQRLAALLQPGEELARIGGDEFAVVLAGGDPAERTDALLAALHAPVVVRGIAVQVGASAGVACSRLHGRDPGELLRRADEAMYRAKAKRSGVVVAEAGDGGTARRRVGLLGELGAAIAAGQVRPHFQPQVRAGDGVLVGCEALARWEHPVHGLVAPVLFLPGRAQPALGRALTQAMLLAAAEHAAAWRALGQEVRVAVNLCEADLALDGLLDDVRAACAAHGVPPSALRLEVTETIVMADPDAALERLQALRALGTGLSLDDFGVERSSLAYLDGLPVDELKVDRSFVAGLARPRTAAIVRATVDLAKALDLRTVAEGVEEPAQRDRLEAMGCDALQGWLTGRPVPGTVLLAQAREAAVA